MIAPSKQANHNNSVETWQAVALAAANTEQESYVERLRRQAGQDRVTLSMLFDEFFGIHLKRSDFLKWAHVTIVDLGGTKFRCDYVGEEPRVRPVLRMWGRCPHCHLLTWSAPIRSAADAGRYSLVFVGWEHDCWALQRPERLILPVEIPQPKASKVKIVVSVLERAWSLLTGLPE